MKPKDLLDAPLSELLATLARQMATKQSLSLSDFYSMLMGAEVYVLVPDEMDETEGALGFELEGKPYQLMFLAFEQAQEVADKCMIKKIHPLEARTVMKRIRPNVGLVVDWGTDGEVRFSPGKVIEFNERNGIWPVKQEATEQWLAENFVNLDLGELETTKRQEIVKREWESINKFPVLPKSRRDKRINHFLEVFVPDEPDLVEARLAQLWKVEYERNPYLHHLSDEDLLDRQKAILTNLLFADRDPLPHEFHEIEWREKLYHVQMECEDRGLSFDEAKNEFDARKSWPRINAGIDVFRRYSGPPGQLFRFSKKKYLLPFLEQGKLSLFPASGYKNEALRDAQRDDELSRSWLVDGTSRRIMFTDSTGVTHTTHAIGSMTFTNKLKSDFYAWFASTAYDPRLFDDFGQDACLIIHDFNEFSERLLTGVEEALVYWSGAATLVNYYDPLDADDLILFHSDKHFRFSYQREYRFSWFPLNTAARNLKRLDINLGPMTDIASLIYLDEN